MSSLLLPLDMTATTLKRLAETERLSEEKYLVKVTGWQLGSGERPKFFPPQSNTQGQG
ncbi:hypothetical protein H6G04_34945 [Calothrix membranacea FACHB-236]|nr:hypothetical protein [Calothrix membranacea FACHB-236]